MTTTIWISSGEGEIGRTVRYRGAPTLRALRARLTRERCGGDRWAHVLLETAERHPERVDEETAIRALSR